MFIPRFEFGLQGYSVQHGAKGLGGPGFRNSSGYPARLLEAYGPIGRTQGPLGLDEGALLAIGTYSLNPRLFMLPSLIDKP